MHIPQSAELSQLCCTQVSVQLLTSWPIGLRNHKKVSSHQQLRTFKRKDFRRLEKEDSPALWSSSLRGWYAKVRTGRVRTSWLVAFPGGANSSLGKISLQDERSGPKNFLQPRLQAQLNQIQSYLTPAHSPERNEISPSFPTKTDWQCTYRGIADVKHWWLIKHTGKTFFLDIT